MQISRAILHILHCQVTDRQVTWNHTVCYMSFDLFDMNKIKTKGGNRYSLHWQWTMRHCHRACYEGWHSLCCLSPRLWTSNPTALLIITSGCSSKCSESTMSTKCGILTHKFDHLLSPLSLLLCISSVFAFERPGCVHWVSLPLDMSFFCASACLFLSSVPVRSGCLSCLMFLAPLTEVTVW